MLVRSMLLVLVCVLGCQSKSADAPPKSPSSLAEKMQAARELAAAAEAAYHRQLAKLAEIEEVLAIAEDAGSEDAIAKMMAMQTQQQSRVLDAKLAWEKAEREVRFLAQEIIEE